MPHQSIFYANNRFGLQPRAEFVTTKTGKREVDSA